MRVHQLEKDAAPAGARRVYDAIEAGGGTVGNFLKTLAHRPEVLRAYNLIVGSLWDANSELPHRTKELAYLRASIINDCVNCTSSHTTGGLKRGVTESELEALKEPGATLRSDLFDPVDLAVLRYVDLLTSRPGNVRDVDLDALGEHLSEGQIVELAIVVATANWTNRINEGLRIPVQR